MFSALIISSLFILVKTEASTSRVFTISPTSAVSPPHITTFRPNSDSFSLYVKYSLIIVLITSPEIKRLFRPILLDIKKFPVAPTHNISSIFITIASLTIPLKTEILSVSL